MVGSATYTDREVGLAYAQFARKGDRSSGEQAMRLLLKVEETGNADAEVHAQLGFLQHISGNEAAAETEYASALRLDPDEMVAASNLAVLYAAKGRTEDALRLLREAVQRDPSQTTNGMNLAFLECSAGRPAEAALILKSIRRFNPDDPTLRSFIATGIYRGGTCLLHPGVD